MLRNCTRVWRGGARVAQAPPLCFSARLLAVHPTTPRSPPTPLHHRFTTAAEEAMPNPSVQQPYTAIDHNIFNTVQEQMEQDNVVREAIRDALKKLDVHVKQITATLSRVHSVPPSEVPQLVERAAPSFVSAKTEIHGLIAAVKNYPYYKYNSMWARDMQSYVFLLMFNSWLDRMYSTTPGAPQNALLSIEEAGKLIDIPVNLKSEDAFHLTIEDYLHGIISLVEELARLMTNAVTQRDFSRPMAISTFVKDVHAAFQVLNLKNDSLRRRGDGLKYHVKKVEDITYDLIVRNLIPQTGAAAAVEDVKME